MSRTLILNISALAQTLPAIYGGHVISVGHGRVVSDETSVAVSEMGGFASIDGKWVIYPVSTDTLEGDYDVASGGLALLATFVGGGRGGSSGPVYWSDVQSKPTFSPVATSGDYDDLSNKPTLADVAESGLYSDLSGTPAIPSASNTSPTDVSTTAAAGVSNAYARGDHQHAHSNLSGGSLHSAATTVSAGFMSAADKTKLDGLAPVATSGSYTDLSDKPDLSGYLTSIPDGSVTDAKIAGVAAAKVTGLSAVATSGSYNDLTGKPSPFSGDYEDLTNKPSLATVATSGSASDLSNQPYDMMFSGSGALAVGKVVMTAPAPRAMILQSIQQGSGDTAQVVIKVNGVNASYPQSVASGAMITAVVSTAGTDCYFSITGKVA